MNVSSLDSPLTLRSKMLDELYRRHWGELCRYISKTFGKGPPEPEDVAQQVFVTFAGLKDLAGIENPRAYLYRTAHNLVINERRKLAGHALTKADQAAVIEEKSDDFTPERVLMAEERLVVLNAAIRALPEERRRSFLFNRLHGLSCAQIARRTGYSESAVKKHVAQAMDALEAALTAAEQAKDGVVGDRTEGTP